VEEGFKVFDVSFVTDGEPAGEAQPRKEPLGFPSSFVAAQFTAVLSAPGAGAVGRNHADAKGGHLGVQRIAVVGFIANEALRQSAGEARVHGAHGQLYLGGRSTLHAHGDWIAMSVCHSYDLGAFATLGGTDSRAPLFAGAKVPSMKHSLKSSRPSR